MKYAMLIYPKPGVYEAMSPEEREATSREYFALRDHPGCLDGAQLQPVETTTTVRVEDGRTLTTDGPFADTKEAFAGYYVFDLANLDEALQIASRIPAARLNGSVEIRPIVEY
jgi:hypothetical protein